MHGQFQNHACKLQSTQDSSQPRGRMADYSEHARNNKKRVLKRHSFIFYEKNQSPQYHYYGLEWRRRRDLKSHAGRIVGARRFTGCAPSPPCFAASRRQNRSAILPRDPRRNYPSR